MIEIEAPERKRSPRRSPEVPKGHCYGCLKRLPKGAKYDFCAQCTRQHERHERELERSYQEARELCAAAYEAEMEEWREQRREQRRQEQEAYEILKEERRSARLNEERAEWDGFLRKLIAMQEGIHE
jgi:nitroreductase